MPSDSWPDAVSIPFEDFADGLVFGESPRYQNGKLLVSDMMKGRIYEYDTTSSGGSGSVFLESPNSMNGSDFLPDGSFVYTSFYGKKLYILREGQSEVYADLSHLMTGYCGDMIVDDQGTIYLDDVGCRPFHGDRTSKGRIIAVKPDRTAHIAAENMYFPNGIVLDRKQTTLYVVETWGGCLTAFDITAPGQLENRRIVLDNNTSFDGEGTHMDGICIDSEDGIWLTYNGQGIVARRSAEGAITHVVRTGDTPTAVTLGGEDGCTLYIVINTVPEGMKLLDAMPKKLTTGNIKTAKAPFGRRVPTARV